MCLGDQPTAQATFPIDSSCAKDSVPFYNVPVTPFANEWYWYFSNGAYAEGDTVKVVFDDTGWIDLEYIVGHHGCYDTVNYDSVVYIMGPIATFAPDIDCDTPMVRWFNTALWKGVQRFYWDFDDGSAVDSVNQTPIHTYAQSGNYNVQLTTYNDTFGCYYTFDLITGVRDVKAKFNVENYNVLPVDSVACHPGTFLFHADSSVDEENNYWWQLGNLETFADTVYAIEYQFLTTGKTDITLRAVDINGCTDTARHSVFVSKPQADFSHEYAGGCDPVGIDFTDLSISDTTIYEWYWYYGDGTSDTNILNPSHNYYNVGAYPVTLVITDSIGCTHSKTKPVFIETPLVEFQMDSIICELGTVEVLNQSAGDSLTYFWNFGNNVTNTIENPGPVLYVDPGEYTVFLAIESDLGCQDTAFKTLHVKPKPKVKFTSDTASSPCLPLFVSFIDSTEGDDLASWKWTFGDGTGQCGIRYKLGLSPLQYCWHF